MVQCFSKAPTRYCFSLMLVNAREGVPEAASASLPFP